ncbi:LruC domain-containing protein, partial [Vibrio azureus]
AHNGDVVRVDVVGQLAAYGASYNNGFALHFPGIDRAMVDAASSRFYRNQTQVGTMLDMNATELIVIASNDLKNALTFNSGCDYHRTESHCLNEPVQFTFNAKMPLASAQPSSTFIETGSMPGGYDPFIFGGGGWRETPPGGGLGREFEIHTADRAPTSVGGTVSSSFFTQGDDISDGTVYYRNSNQLPWGIIITDDWAHSLEYRDISQTYPEFPTFVTTSGAQSADWYTPSKASYGYYGSDNGVMHVTVSGGKYYLNGVEAPSLTLQRGRTYVFEQHEGTNAGHPLAIRTTDDQPYTSGVMSYGGDAGSMRSQVKFQVPMDAPDSLRYYCTVHGNGMGNVLNITN